MADDRKTELIYNGACPVCDAGVRAFRDDAGSVTYTDITAKPEILEHHGLTPRDVQYRVHAVGPNGNLVRGIDAAVLLVAQKPGWRLIGKALQLPGLRQLGWIAYEATAFLLFRWNTWRGNF